MNGNVLITGANMGLGRAITEMFSSRGFHVIATDISTDILKTYIESPMVLPLVMDVTSPESVKSVSELLKDKEIQISILINNAGIYDMYPLAEADPERFARIFQVNLFGSLITIRSFLKDLIEQEGRVIQISSESTKFPSLFQPYQVTKVAVEAFSKSIRQELALKGVKLAIISPGAIRTSITNNLSQYINPQSNSVFEREFVDFVKESSNYIGRIASPEEVAKVVYKAALAKNPKHLYKINHNPWLTLLSLIPEKLIVRFIRWKFKPR